MWEFISDFSKIAQVLMNVQMEIKFTSFAEQREYFSSTAYILKFHELKRSSRQNLLSIENMAFESYKLCILCMNL